MKPNFKPGSEHEKKFKLIEDLKQQLNIKEVEQKSISEQMSKSKDNTQAYANMVSAVNGESQSDANSTARKVSQAYSEQESASQTYQATKTQGTAMGDNLMNSAFQNYFSKNADRFEKCVVLKKRYKVEHLKEESRR